MICAIQNIQVLIKHGYSPKKSTAIITEEIKKGIAEVIKPVSDVLYRLEGLITEFRWNFPMSFRLTEFSQ